MRYLGVTVTNTNDIRKEIKHRINMENTCYYSLEEILSSCLLSKKLKVKTCKTIILPVVQYGCETWSLTLREEQRLRVFKNKVLSMGGSPGELSEELVTQEKQKKVCRMNCDIGEATEGLENEL